MTTDPSRRPSLLQRVREDISPFSETPYLDALVLLNQLLNVPRSRLLAHPSPELTDLQAEELTAAVGMIRAGVPLPYILGRWECYQRTFYVSPDVLIPRPETEGLIDRASQWIRDHPQAQNILDLGTGSGCIAVTLAALHPRLELIATDRSGPALRIAQKNAARHDVAGQIEFIQADLLAGLSARFDMICANLPYIPRDRLATLAVSKHEPRIALDGGSDGLLLIREFLENSAGFLKTKGAILLEIDESHGPAALQLARDCFRAGKIQLEQDLSGLDRYLWIQA